MKQNEINEAQSNERIQLQLLTMHDPHHHTIILRILKRMQQLYQIIPRPSKSVDSIQ